MFDNFRFTVREFTYNAEELEAGKNEIKKLDADRKKQFVSILEKFIAVLSQDKGTFDRVSAVI